MSTWAISVPHRGRDESLIDTASNCRHLPEGERDVARQIVFDAMQDGVRTAGGLLDRLDSLEPAERRQLLDHARQECGLPSIADVDARARAEAASKAGAVVASQYDPKLCNGKTPAGLACNAIGMTDYGVPAPSNVRRWFCAEHRDQARPGDMDPLPAPWRYSPERRDHRSRPCRRSPCAGRRRIPRPPGTSPPRRRRRRSRHRRATPGRHRRAGRPRAPRAP